MKRVALAGVSVAVLAGGAAAAWLVSTRTTTKDLDAPPTVVLIVEDTIRADHLSACGYERPTTPYLAELARKGALRCDAITPASWTVASHASYFTGLPVDEHGTMFREEGEELHANIKVRPLDERFDTLAERFARAGYQTAFLSGNPSLHDGSGLTQGFQHHRVKTPDGHWLRGPRLQRSVRGVLGELEKERPLFLVVNIFEAHDPWPTASPDMDWVPAHERVVLEHDRPESPYVRFHHHEMAPDEAEPYLETIADAYDANLYRADEALRGVVDALTEGGWLSRPYRMIVTSDHGELLGEHERLRHGGNVYEGNLRVPFLWIEPSGHPDLDGGLLASIALHDILLTGRRPRTDTVWSFTEPAQMHPSPGVWGVARYRGQEKEVVTSDGSWDLDLAKDPKEVSLPTAPPDPELEERLKGLRERASEPFTPTGNEDEEALRALGYVE